MFCNQCGEENRNDRKFCSSCGAQLRDYTKPRENLLMPDDIKKEQEYVKNKNHLIKVFYISMAIILLIAAVLTITSFFVPGNWKLITAIISTCFYIAFLIVWGVKRSKIKQLNNREK